MAEISHHWYSWKTGEKQLSLTFPYAYAWKNLTSYFAAALHSLFHVRKNSIICISKVDRFSKRASSLHTTTTLETEAFPSSALCYRRWIGGICRFLIAASSFSKLASCSIGTQANDVEIIWFIARQNLKKKPKLLFNMLRSNFPPKDQLLQSSVAFSLPAVGKWN